MSGKAAFNGAWGWWWSRATLGVCQPGGATPAPQVRPPPRALCPSGFSPEGQKKQQCSACSGLHFRSFVSQSAALLKCKQPPTSQVNQTHKRKLCQPFPPSSDPCCLSLQVKQSPRGACGRRRVLGGGSCWGSLRLPSCAFPSGQVPLGPGEPPDLLERSFWLGGGEKGKPAGLLSGQERRGCLA